VRRRAAVVSPNRIKTFPQSSVVIDLDDIGPEWILGGWFKGEEDWCLAAWEWAGKFGAE
jgi:hypothetical protein